MPLPIIDLERARNPDTRPALLEDLRNALFRIGFFYLINHGLEKQSAQLLDTVPAAFGLPEETKWEVAMVNNPHFVGYTQLGAEKTKNRLDLREQYDFGSAKESAYIPGEPLWKKLHGPTEYISDAALPGFQRTVESYIFGMAELSSRVLQLTAESLGLPADEFDAFKGKMDRLKIIKYPSTPTDPSVPDELRTTQGVGPHKDSSGMFTYVLQDSVGGLQVLDSNGDWIDATPIAGSFVVNIAQGFEALTGGRCLATTHRVISPSENVTRYSIPFFQGVRLDLTPDEIQQESDRINGVISEGPADTLRRERAAPSEFLDPKYTCFGEAHLRNRIISHRDVAQRWYPDLLAKYVADLK